MNSDDSDSNRTLVSYGKDLNFKLTADSGYKLPENICIKVGGKPIGNEQFNYDFETGKVSIPGELITNTIEIEAEAQPIIINITIDWPAKQMKFKYIANNWDPDLHKNNDDIIRPKSSNKISIKNNSNIGIDAEFQYVSNPDCFNELNGYYTSSNDCSEEPIKALTIGSDSFKDVYFWLNGYLTDKTSRNFNSGKCQINFKNIE